jgi:hypothetical protein
MAATGDENPGNVAIAADPERSERRYPMADSKEVAMRTNLKSRLGRASAAVAVGVMALVGVASTADARDWRYNNWHRHHHHWNGWAVSNGYHPYYHRHWNRGWRPYAYYPAPRYYAPSYGLVVR